MLSVSDFATPSFLMPTVAPYMYGVPPRTRCAYQITNRCTAAENRGRRQGALQPDGGRLEYYNTGGRNYGVRVGARLID